MPTPNGDVRLNKFLVDHGIASRRGADRLIEDGVVTVNGTTAVLGQKVNGTDRVAVNGKAVAERSKRVYLAYNKPVGIICTSDPKAQDNIIDAINYPERIFHIGRLDVASSGLILLTNDGDIVNKILRAEGEHDKEYVVEVHKPVTQDFLYAMSNGVMLDDRRTLPARVYRISPTSFSVTIVEGRNRQIRRMCEELGYEVVALKRIRIMHIHLDKLPSGHFRHLTKQEEDTLIKNLK